MNRIYSFFKKHYFISYTVLFCAFSLLVFWYFPLYHKSFIWQQDGLKQHYNGLLYYSKYLKDIINTLIREHRFYLPMWDHSIGYGSDIITTLHYYAVGDPLTLLSAFVPLSLMEFFYAFLFFLRSYIGGLGFSCMSLNRGFSRFYTLMGALVYCFASFGLILGLMHGIFMVPVCYFPWMIYGIDRIFEKKSPAVFILSLAAAAAANFYFLYMEVVLFIVYVIHKFIAEEQERYEDRQGVSVYAIDLLKRFLQFMIYGINAFLLSALILLPVLNLMLTSKRFAAEKYVPILYPFKHYMNLMADFMIRRNAGSWTLMGFTSCGLLAVLVLLSKKSDDKEIKRIRARFLTLTLFAMIPACGFVINGFAYVTNRWTFAWALSAAMVISSCLPLIGELTAEEKKRILIGEGVIVFCSAFFYFVRTEESMLSMAVLMILTFILLFSGIPKKYQKPVILAALAISLGSNGWYAYSAADSDFLSEFLAFRETDRKLNSAFPLNILESEGDDSFYRTEVSGTSKVQNSSIQTGFKGTQFYFSLTSPYISDFINSMYYNWPKDYDYDGTESRAGLEALAAVKYYVAGEDNLYKVPSGFSEVKTDADDAGKKVHLFKNEHALPLGFSCDRIVDNKTFEGLSVTGRQNALLSGAVLSDSDADELRAAGYGEADITDDSVNVLKSIDAKGDMDIEGNTFKVRNNAGVEISFDGKAGAETYLIFKNLKFEGYKERERYNEGGWSALSPYEKAKVRSKNTTDSRPSVTSLMVSLNGNSEIVEFYNYRNDFYCGRENFLVNFGDTGDGEMKASISFREPGVYTFDSLEVRSQPLNTVFEKTDALKETTLTDIKTEQDLISGSINCKNNELLMLSVPYSKGWKAFVDGKESKVYRADLMYIMIPVNAGEHSIVLKYETPLLRIGAILTVIGIIMFFVLLLSYRKGRVLKRS